MKAKTIARFAGAAMLAALCVFGMGACSSKQVAATVEGVEIYEDDITSYIENIRQSYDLTDEASWANYLISYDYTPQKLREEVIDIYVDKELTKLAAEENGVSVSDEDVQAQVDKMKANYTDDEAWQKALSQSGMTEDSYKESLKESMLEEALIEKVCDTEDPDNSTLLLYAQMYSSYWDGAKRSSHILFAADDEATAQEVLDKLKAGEITFKEAAAQYSTDTGTKDNGGDVGWDVLNSFVTEYTDALANLNKGELSGLVTSQYGIHIIKCTDVFNAPESLTKIKQLPKAFRDYLKTMIKSSNQESDYEEWLETYKEGKNVEVKDMPEGLSYYVDLSAYKSSSSGSSDDSTTDATNTEATNEASNEASNTTNESTEGSEDEGSDDGVELGETTVENVDFEAEEE